MARMITLPPQVPVVEHRRLALTEQDAQAQIMRGVYVIDRGERIPIPVDSVRQLQDGRRGIFRPQPTLSYLNRDLWRQDDEGRVYRPGVRMQPRRWTFQRKALEWARDHIDPSIPHWYYMATLGHDLHVSIFCDLFGRHWHSGWANPFDPDNLVPSLDPAFETMRLTHFMGAHDCRLGNACPAIGTTWAQKLGELSMLRGFVENLGWLSGRKVTDIFVSETVDELVSATASEFADFDFHEVGTSTQAESNDDTALIATTGIARAAGTPTDADPVFVSTATVTADATESFEENGQFNNSTGPALLDRALTGGQAVNASDTVEYERSTTFNPEA